MAGTPSEVLVDTKHLMKQQYLAMPAVMSFLEVSSISSMAKGNYFKKKYVIFYEYMQIAYKLGLKILFN